MAQETQTGALYQPRGRWEGGSKGRGYMYTYGWFMLRFDRKQNSVKQLPFNKIINKKMNKNKRELSIHSKTSEVEKKTKTKLSNPPQKENSNQEKP